MNKLDSVVDWLDTYQNVAFDLLRIYLGVGLFVRGILFVSEPSSFLSLAGVEGDSWLASDVVFAYVAFAHLLGGAMLAAGFLTRLAALLQIPILAGAVFLVHVKGGLLTTADQSLEFSALVLFLLVLLFVYGAGRWSVDHYRGTGLRLFSGLEAWSTAHRDVAFDVLRIYLGIGLFVRGALFVADSYSFMQLIPPSSGEWITSVVVVHYVALAHLVGGAMMAAGLLTRLAVLAQIPILVGAVFVVHLEGGLLTSAGQSFEFAALVLFLLVLVFLYGSGRWSADFLIFSRRAEIEPEAQTLSPTASAILNRHKTPGPALAGGGSVAVAEPDVAVAEEVALTCPLYDNCPVVAQGAAAHEHPWVQAQPHYSIPGWFAFFWANMHPTPRSITFTCTRCGQIINKSRSREDREQYMYH